MSRANMPTRPLGSTSVGAVALGGARWSLTAHPDDALAEATIRSAREAGVTLFDTAPAYTTPDHPSHNETLMGSVLADELAAGAAVVSTKGGHIRTVDGGLRTDAHPDSLRRHCEDSLRALSLDCIPLYSLHWPDPAVPLIESVGALADLRAAGKVAMVGVCNVTVSQLDEASTVTAIDAVQHRFSPLDQANLPLVERCGALGIAFMAYSPFGGTARARILGDHPGIATVAAGRAVSPHQVAIAWLLGHPGLVPIVGAGRPRSIIDATGGGALELTADEAAAIADSRKEIA